MALKIRLRRQGRTNRPFYRVVVADTRSPSDGKYVECLGWYNPFEEELDKKIQMNEPRLKHWLLDIGAELTDKTKALVNQKAPEIVKAITEKKLNHRAKMAQKKRQSRRSAKEKK